MGAGLTSDDEQWGGVCREFLDDIQAREETVTARAAQDNTLILTDLCDRDRVPCVLLCH
jgi:hypothetical protein